MLPQLLDIPSLEEWGDMLQAFGDIALVKGFIIELMDECFHLGHGAGVEERGF